MTFTPVKKLTFSAILIALGIIIPMVMPVKIVIGPASFTLASHVPVFLAMFISPGVAVAVALGTAFGFFFSFPFIIALRALSHLFFAIIGALYLQKRPELVANLWQFQLFNLMIGLIHAVMELAVVMFFYLQGNLPGSVYNQQTLYTLFFLVGFGGFIHSLIDYNMAYYLGSRLSKQFKLPVFVKGFANKRRSAN